MGCGASTAAEVKGEAHGYDRSDSSLAAILAARELDDDGAKKAFKDDLMGSWKVAVSLGVNVPEVGLLGVSCHPPPLSSTSAQIKSEFTHQIEDHHSAEFCFCSQSLY
jgi:hypothetical protein